MRIKTEWRTSVEVDSLFDAHKFVNNNMFLLGYGYVQRPRSIQIYIAGNIERKIFIILLHQDSGSRFEFLRNKLGTYFDYYRVCGKQLVLTMQLNDIDYERLVDIIEKAYDVPVCCNRLPVRNTNGIGYMPSVMMHSVPIPLSPLSL